MTILWEAVWKNSILLGPLPGKSPGKSSLVAQTVKRLLIMWETQVQSLGRKDLLEEDMATHSSILAWRFPWTEEHGGLQSVGFQRVGHDWATVHTGVREI